MNSKFNTRFNRAPSMGVRFDKPSLVQPQFKQSCDINCMIKRALGGDMSVFRSCGHIVDASDAPDSYHDAMNIVARADQAWESLPDAVKRAYGNSANFIQAYEKSFAETSVSSETSKIDKTDKTDKTEVRHPEGAEVSTPKSVPNT